MKQKHIAIIAVLISALMWALEPISAKLSYTNATFLQTSIIRAYTITIIAFFYVLITKKPSSLHITKPQYSTLFYIAVAGTLGADLLYFYALVSTPVLNAVLLGHLQPAFIILFAFIFLSYETLTRPKYIGVFFMMLSAFFVTTKTIENLFLLTFGTIGDLLVLVATILWATTALAMRHSLTKIPAGTITFYRFFIASVVFTSILPFIHITNVNIYQVFVGIIVAIGTICYYEGLKRLKAAEVSSIELAAPVFAALIGFFILYEPITPFQIIGILTLFIGVHLITKTPNKENRQ